MWYFKALGLGNTLDVFFFFANKEDLLTRLKRTCHEKKSMQRFRECAVGCFRAAQACVRLHPVPRRSS